MEGYKGRGRIKKRYMDCVKDDQNGEYKDDGW